jgi:membrane fusion protein (multidrug efflux system)
MAASPEKASRIGSSATHADAEQGSVVSIPLNETSDVTARRPAETVPTDAAIAPAPETRRSLKKLILPTLISIAVAAAAGFGGYYMLVGRYIVSTDDAYVRANATTIGARVSGHIQSVYVADNSSVHSGDLLVQIDDGDYRLAVQSAQGKVATEEATLERIDRQIKAQESAVEQANAQVTSANAASKQAEADFNRQQELSSKGFASKAAFDLAQASRDQTAAAVKSAQAALAASQANVEVIKAQRVEAASLLQELKTAQAKAERDLSFTTIRAPVDGVFSNRMANPGDFIQPGQRLGNLVPLDAVYIDANFKETQLARLRPGQHVKISVDAISERRIDGVIESVSPASGAVFSLLPPDNATGNFTKVVQRIPVRIRVPADVAKENLLRAGMSVEVSVDTRSNDAPPTSANSQG